MTKLAKASPDEAYRLAKLKGLAGLKGLKITDNFLWTEAFIHCSEADLQKTAYGVFKNILAQANTMELVRKQFGAPIIVSSWYRSYARNQRIGGSDTSFHLYGLATDFVVVGYETAAGNKSVQKTLDPLGFMQKCELEWTYGRWTHVATAGRRLRPHAR